MTTDCSLFMKIVSSEYLQKMLCTQIFGTQHVLQMLRASEKDLPVLLLVFLADWAVRVFNIFMGQNKYKIGLSVHTLQCIVVSARKS